MKIKSLASGSKGNCYYISDGNTSLLIEAGIPIKKIKEGLNYRLSEVDGCLISHAHGDHSKAVKDLCKTGIDCWMSEETAKILNIYNHRIEKYPETLSGINIGNFRVSFFETEHDIEGSRGFLINSYNTNKNLVYISDSYYCRYNFSNLNYIMLEINYSTDILNANVKKGIIPETHKNRVIKSHMSLETAKEFLKANNLSKVEEIWLLHLSDLNSDEILFKREIQELTGKPVFIA